MNSKIHSEIVKLIDRKSEGDYWDYKQEWHKDNERLLVDILCFANTVHNKDCYIIIGVSDNGEIIGLTKESSNRKNQAEVLDLLSNSMFAGDYVPDVSVETISIKNKEIDILTIFNSYNVPFYLKSKSKKYNKIINGYIYSRKGDRNTPISENSSMQQIELLWKKRLGLLNPPLNQIISRMRNKFEWEENDDTYYNIYNPDFKIVEKWNHDEYGNYEKEFYSYNQCNESTSYIDLNILYRETILKELQVVILDSGRYKTPVPIWGFIKDNNRPMDSLYDYKYILKNSIEYAVQQFIYNEDSEEARMAKKRFDEVILYFQDKQEQQEFHESIEECPEVVEQYIEDAKLNKYYINSNNELEVKDCTEKLITGFAFKRYLFDYRRKKKGIDVKRIKSIKIANKQLCLSDFVNIVEHRIEIQESGSIEHSLYNKEDESPVSIYNYSADKYWIRNLLNFIEPITTEWNEDYSVVGFSDYEWTCILDYVDDTSKIIKGNFKAPPSSYDIERRIKNLVDYEVEPLLF
nr:ATP-binding protein [Clostridium botulinum]